MNKGSSLAGKEDQLPKRVRNEVVPQWGAAGLEFPRLTKRCARFALKGRKGVIDKKKKVGRKRLGRRVGREDVPLRAQQTL